MRFLSGLVENEVYVMCALSVRDHKHHASNGMYVPYIKGDFLLITS